MRAYYYIIKNRRGQVATDNRIKADKAPIGWGKPFHFETKKKADNFASKLNAYFGCFMYLKKDEFFAVRQSEVVADPKPVEPKPVEPKPVKTEDYLLNTYKKTGAMWEMGTQLPSIVRDLAEVYGDKVIDVLVPIGSCSADEEDSYIFHCFGSARDIADEIPRLMPSHKERLSPENAKTCYYGDNNNIGSGTFLPFLADDSVYHIESINKTAEKVVIKLIRGLDRWAYL